MKHVAVIGSGIAGLAAAYFLSRKHRVTLYEKADRLGGHTHTVTVDDEGGPLSLDLGFLVHNERTYPNLVRLFAELDVPTVRTEGGSNRVQHCFDLLARGHSSLLGVKSPSIYPGPIPPDSRTGPDFPAVVSPTPAGS